MTATARLSRSTITAFILAVPVVLHAQISTISSNLARTEGVDASSGIAYTRLYISALSAQSQPPSASPTSLDLTLPTLTVQCSKRPNGNRFLELFVNFGGVTDTAFYPPWKPDKSNIFPPATVKTTLTMEFLGYTTVKPVKRQWEYVLQPDGQLRYNPPSGRSTNLEPITYYFQYLRALPTLRVTRVGHTASFLTDTLQAQMLKEPLCVSTPQ